MQGEHEQTLVVPLAWFLYIVRLYVVSMCICDMCDPQYVLFFVSFPPSYIDFASVLQATIAFLRNMQHAEIEHGPHRYDATLLTSTLCYTRQS